jgi:hypothetical protein
VSDAGRWVLIGLLCAGAVVLLGRTWARPPSLGPPLPAPRCPVAVEREGEGVVCLEEPAAAALGLAQGDTDRIAPDGKRGRMAPCRLQLFAVPIDVNAAPVEELASLPGIGPGLAARIAAARPFRSVDEVALVPGIGRRRLEAMRARLRIGS